MKIIIWNHSYDIVNKLIDKLTSESMVNTFLNFQIDCRYETLMILGATEN